MLMEAISGTYGSECGKGLLLRRIIATIILMYFNALTVPKITDFFLLWCKNNVLFPIELAAGFQIEF
jgi:hypothetical protein